MSDALHNPRRVAVIGGGYAGMAAAVTLAEQRVPVTVYEAGATLGGRARRVDVNGVTLDNGLHILIGAYRETLRLIAQVHLSPADALLRLPLNWNMHECLHLRAPKLPAPLHLVTALLTATGANWGERWAAIRMMRALRVANFRLPRDMTVSILLAGHAQGPVLTQHLWNPLCVSALNTPPEKASAQLFLNVLRDGLNADREGSDLLIARVDLSALFPEPAADYVRATRGEVLTGRRVTAVEPVTGGFHVTAGDTRKFSHLICALPPHQVPAFLAGITALSETMDTVQALAYQPITSVYLQFSGRVQLPSPMTGLASSCAQWLFDREAICGQNGLIGAVISAEGPHQDLPQDALAAGVHDELAAKFGPLPPLTWHRVIREKRATFCATPGLHRPPQKTPLKDFWLAGDYTESDYPATLEAAVRSGIASARGILGQSAAL
jgi:squalene-associated FAD-dependent desaturase